MLPRGAGEPRRRHRGIAKDRHPQLWQGRVAKRIRRIEFLEGGGGAEERISGLYGNHYDTGYRSAFDQMTNHSSSLAGVGV